MTPVPFLVAGLATLGLWGILRAQPNGLRSQPKWRRDMIERARWHLANRTPYEWGGGHHGPSWGLDCSGLVIDAANAAGLNIATWWSSRSMRDQLPVVDVPKPGDVAVYSPRHVVLVESFDPKTGLATILGANGGNSNTTSEDVALSQNARTKREPTHLYRAGFLGFRSTAPWAAHSKLEPAA